MSIHNARCIARHTGLWCAHVPWLNATMTAIRAGTHRLMSMEDAEERSAPQAHVTEDGIGVISIVGPMMKGASKFGNVDTVATRGIVRQFGADTNIRGVIIRADSPGGAHDGTDDLYHDIATLAKAKPVYTQIEDLGASALMYATAGSSQIYATPSSEVGSIGTYAMVADTSKQAEMEGVTMHVVSTGPMKGAFADGTPITPEQLAYLQSHVAKAFGFFADAMKKGRGMSDKKLAAVATGETWFAEEAQTLGLIDGVQRMDETVEAMRKEIKNRAMADRNKRRLDMERLRR